MSEEYIEPEPTHILVDIAAMYRFLINKDQIKGVVEFALFVSPKICLDEEHMKKWGKFKAEQFYLMSDRNTEVLEAGFAEGAKLFATCLRNEFQRKQEDAKANG